MNLEQCSVLQGRMLRHELNGMIHVPRLKHANAAELLLGFRIGAVRRCDFAVLPLQGQRRFRRLKRFSYSARKMPVGEKMASVFKSMCRTCRFARSRLAACFCWLVVSHPDVFHCSSPRSSLLGSPAFADFSFTVSGNEAQQILI